MSIAILGAGQLGKELYDALLNKKYACKLFSHKEFDINNIKQLHDIVKDFDIIVNCVANINADKIEKEQKDDSFNVNYLAVKNLAILCKKYNKQLLHISSDYVYGSNDYSEILNEDYVCHPINQYGIDKLTGENAIINEHLDRFAIFRVSWLIGKYGKQNFIEKIKTNLNSKDEIKVVDDQIGNITSTLTVIDAIEKFIDRIIPNGIYNIQNNDEYVSRYNIACYIKECISSKCKIIPCKTSDYILPALRQMNSKLDTTKIRKYIDIKNWKNVIEEYL